MPFKSDARLPRERDIRYGTSLKNSTDNLHTAMALDKCQILSAVCTEQLLPPICPHESEEPGIQSWSRLLPSWRQNVHILKEAKVFLNVRECVPVNEWK